MSGFVTIFVFEMVNSMNVKVPEGLDTTNREAFAAWMNTLPPSAFMLVLAGYIAAAFEGAAIATAISGREAVRPAIMVGIILTIGNFANLAMIPQPTWFAVLSSVVYLPFAYLGYIALRKRN